MATLADVIEAYIKRQLAQAGTDVIEIQRRDVARQFDCVPSQINYVLETRFTPQRGYCVESRRGGGGYIRITRVVVRRKVLSARNVFDEIGSRISREVADSLLARLEEVGLLTEREGVLIRNALRQETSGLEPPVEDVVRAKLLRAMLLVAFQDRNS